MTLRRAQGGACAYCNQQIRTFVYRAIGKNFCSQECAVNAHEFMKAAERLGLASGCVADAGEAAAGACKRLGLSAPVSTGAWIARNLGDGIEAGLWGMKWGRGAGAGRFKHCSMAAFSSAMSVTRSNVSVRIRFIAS